MVPTPPESNPKGARAIRIGAIRELERQVALRPVMGRHKVFVVDDADRMTGESPQAFLKTLDPLPHLDYLLFWFDVGLAVASPHSDVGIILRLPVRGLQYGH